MRPSRLPIDCVAMTGIDDDDRQHCVLDSIQNPAVAAAYSPFRAGGKFLRRWRSSIFAKKLDHRLHAALCFWGKLSDCSGCDGKDLNRVCHDSPRSRFTSPQGMGVSLRCSVSSHAASTARISASSSASANSLCSWSLSMIATRLLTRPSRHRCGECRRERDDRRDLLHREREAPVGHPVCLSKDHANDGTI